MAESSRKRKKCDGFSQTEEKIRLEYDSDISLIKLEERNRKRFTFEEKEKY